MLTWFNARIWALCAGDQRTHIHIHMRAYMHTHTHTYIHTHIQTYTHPHRQNDRYFAGSNFGYTYLEYSRDEGTQFTFVTFISSKHKYAILYTYYLPIKSEFTLLSHFLCFWIIRRHHTTHSFFRDPRIPPRDIYRRSRVTISLRAQQCDINHPIGDNRKHLYATDRIHPC